MTVWLAGMRITDDRLADVDVVTQDYGLVAASGFSVSSFSGRKAKGITTIELFVTRTGATIAEIASNTGNIADTDMCTLPVGWRPPARMNFVWGTGTNDGEASISNSGLVTLRSTAGTIGVANGANVRVTGRWISGESNGGV